MKAPTKPGRYVVDSNPGLLLVEVVKTHFTPYTLLFRYAGSSELQQMNVWPFEKWAEVED